MTLLLGVVYPLCITGVAQWIFPAKAKGSIVMSDGKPIGSELIGQRLDSSIYFHPRPSSTYYQAMASCGSNLGPTSKKLHGLVETRRSQFVRENHLPENSQVPSEMLFASGSGLDPHISPQAAYLQVERVAAARHLTFRQTTELKTLINRFTEQPQFGLFGCETVNVLKLNLALDDRRQ